jgi:hypothetical protein
MVLNDLMRQVLIGVLSLAQIKSDLEKLSINAWIAMNEVFQSSSPWLPQNEILALCSIWKREINSVARKGRGG